jgi:hypothetical protein
MGGVSLTRSIDYSSLIDRLISDVNGDDVVNILDLVLVAKAWNSNPQDPKWNPKLDLNADGLVNVLDVVIVAKDFGKRSIETEPLTKIRAHLVAYGLNAIVDENVAFVASNFDVVVTGFETASTIGEIKKLNPNITILGYRDIMMSAPSDDDWGEVNSHEDWFLHDVNGKRLVHKDYGCYGMDVGNLGWQSHYARVVKDKLDRYPAFDGVFADDAWDASPYRYEEWTVPPEDIPPEIGQRWHNDMLGIIQNVKTIIGTKLLVLNTENNDDYLDAADGKMFEHFVHKTSWGLDYYGGVDPLQDVDVLAEASKRGKIFLTHSGAKIPDNPTQDDIDKAHNIMLYCLASHLLGVNGEKASFGFNSITSNDGSRGYCPEFDAPLGSPVNQYYLIGSVYARNFTNGRVLVNPTSSAYTVYLQGKYKTLDGQMVSEIVMQAHTGAFLVNWVE